MAQWGWLNHLLKFVCSLECQNVISSIHRLSYGFTVIFLKKGLPLPSGIDTPSCEMSFIRPAILKCMGYEMFKFFKYKWKSELNIIWHYLLFSLMQFV